MTGAATLSVIGRQRLPADLPSRLRELADGIESGAITEMVVGYCENGEFNFLWPSSLQDSLVLATLAQTLAVKRFRG